RGVGSAANLGGTGAGPRAGVGATRITESAILLDGPGGRSAVQCARGRGAGDSDQGRRPYGDRPDAAGGVGGDSGVLTAGASVPSRNTHGERRPGGRGAASAGGVHVG